MADVPTTVLDYSTRRTPRGTRDYVRSIQLVLTFEAVVMAAYVLWRTYTLTEDWIAVAGSSCGTCRRGPFDARLALGAWAVPTGLCHIFSRSSPVMRRVTRVAVFAVVAAWAMSLAFS